MKTMCLKLVGVVLLVMCSIVSAEVTLTDDFSSGLGNWTYVGDAPSTAAGNLNIPNGTEVILVLPGSLANTKSEISFEISNGFVIGWEGDYGVEMDFRDYTQQVPFGLGYYFYASTTTPGGNSGFNGYDATEAKVYGLAGADLGINGEVSRLTLSFDPKTGVTMKQNGVVVLTQPNFRNVSKMTEFRFQSWAGIPWLIDNVVATYNTPIPIPKITLITIH